MGFLDALKKLTKPYADDDYLNDDYEERPARGSFFSRKESRSYEDFAEAPPAEAPAAPRRVSILSGRGSGESRPEGGVRSQQMKLLVMRPERFEDAAAIAEQMRRHSSIVLNLEAVPKETARRLVDFLSGAAFALEGRIRRIAAGSYIITPPDVDLMGEDLGNTESKENYF